MAKSQVQFIAKKDNLLVQKRQEVVTLLIILTNQSC